MLTHVRTCIKINTKDNKISSHRGTDKLVEEFSNMSRGINIHPTRRLSKVFACLMSFVSGCTVVSYASAGLAYAVSFGIHFSRIVEINHIAQILFFMPLVLC